MKYIIQLCLLFMAISFISSCSDSEIEEGKYSFYHWKSNAQSNETISQALDDAKVNTIYLHYFDVEFVDRHPFAFPVSVLKEVDEDYKRYNIVPVVYIANRVFKGEVTPEILAGRIAELVTQINDTHFKDKEIQTIQLDCDWTEHTRGAYFKVIELLKEHFEISVTIRLHQIKFQEETGIPDVAHGTLMLYNMGDLEDENINSIIEPSIVSDYVTAKTSYPLQLTVALPLFSQTVVKNNDGDLRLIAGVDRKGLESDTKHFEKINGQIFQVKADLLYKGLYLFKGYRLKLEEVKAESVIQSYRIIQESNLEHTGIIFYHLDENTLKNIDFTTLAKEL